jgi:ABC-type transport system involved in multi-copper enzyme maturation permease subunit
VNLVTLLFGHLAGTECRRALARGWLIVVRSLLGLLLAAIALFLIWMWWLIVQTNPSYVPSYMLRATLAAGAMILLTIVVVQAPAVLAGSLAGDRERGVLQLLLTTVVSPREIVSGRLLGKLSQVGMIILAGVPFLVLLGAWNGLDLLQLATMFLLLAAVGAGGGGLAVLASITSRRGRDALLSVYILMIALVASPLLAELGLPSQVADGLGSFNPYVSMNRLVWDDETAPALVTSIVWLAMGLAGAALAAWRLRPTCLATGDTVKKSRRRAWVIPLGERPMLWKELYIERVGTLGRFGRWLGVLFTLMIGGGSLVLAGMIVVDLFWRQQNDWSLWATGFFTAWLSDPLAMFMGWLLQWAVGLRAAVSIASERERGTWDALLMSPLDPGEIVRAKLAGSLHALRWMVGAMVLAWTLGTVAGAITPGAYITWIVFNALAATLMAAIGVRCSLSLPTATKAMTWTIALWLAAEALVAFLALSIIAMVCLFFITVWMVEVRYGFVMMNSLPWFPMRFSTAWPLATDLVMVLLTVLIVLDTSLRFDRLSGRMAGGALATSVDQWLRGGSTAPVFLPDAKRAVAKEPDELLEITPEPLRPVDVVVAD